LRFISYFAVVAGVDGRQTESERARESERERERERAKERERERRSENAILARRTPLSAAISLSVLDREDDIRMRGSPLLDDRARVVCVCVCASVRACGYVCARSREREREREIAASSRA